MNICRALFSAMVLVGAAQTGLAQWHSIFQQGIDLSSGGWTPPDGTPDYWVNAELYAPMIIVAPLPKGNGDLVTITNNPTIPLDQATLTVERLSAFYGDPAKHVSLRDMVANPAGLTDGTMAAYPLTLPPNGSRSIDVVIVPGIGMGPQFAPEFHVLFWIPDSSPHGLWASGVNGYWSDSSKWTGGPPDTIGAQATLDIVATAELTVKLDNPQTVGTLQFGNSGNANVGYLLSGSGTNTLTLNNSGSGATITVTDGSHGIDAPVILADNLSVSGSGTLAFGNSSSITGSYSLTMSGSGGTLILSGSDNYTEGTNVTAGTLIVIYNTALPTGSSLTIGAGGTVIFDPLAAGTPVVASAIATVPEPSTLALLGVDAIGLLGCGWRRARWFSGPSDSDR